MIPLKRLGRKCKYIIAIFSMQMQHILVDFGSALAHKHWLHDNIVAILLL